MNKTETRILPHEIIGKNTVQERIWEYSIFLYEFNSLFIRNIFDSVKRIIFDQIKFQRNWMSDEKFKWY